MNSAQKAFKQVADQIASGVWVDGDRLPPLSALAKTCAVSRTTMWSVLGQLKRATLIHTLGKSILCGPAGIPRASEAETGAGCAWIRLRNRIGSEIHAHGFSEKILPPISKLALQYGVAVKTLKKALVSLAADGLLVQEGRHFRLHASSPFRPLSTIVLVSQGTKEQGIFSGIPRNEHVVHALEREGLKSGFLTRFEGFEFTKSSALIEISGVLEEIRHTVGYVLNLWNPGNDEYWQRWLDLVRYLVARLVPVIVLDQEGDLVFPAELLRHKDFRVLRISGERAGEIAADFLMQRNYRHAAYLMPFGADSWARNRFIGLDRHFRRYGGSKRVVECHVSTPIAHSNDLSLAALGLDKQGIIRLHRNQLSKPETEALAARLASPELPLAERMIYSSSAVATVRMFAQMMARLPSKNLDIPVYNAFLRSLMAEADNAAVYRYRMTFFEGVIEKSRATVWVCSDDRTAYEALSFLKRHHRRVPEDISVVGFDDWRESLDCGLTTYNFNVQGMVQHAVLLLRDDTSRKKSPVISEIDGYVVERRTTRR